MRCARALTWIGDGEYLSVPVADEVALTIKL